MKSVQQKQRLLSTGPKTGSWLGRALTNHKSAVAYLEPAIQMFKPNWQAQGFQAALIDKRIESDLVFTLLLKPQKSWPNFTAGQYIEIQVEINGVRYTRIFSLSNSPNYYADSGLIELTIRKQTTGKVTPWLGEHLSAGAVVRISAAQGEFVLPEESHQPLLFIAGGSGITPFRSFLHQLASSNDKKQQLQDVHLVYYNPTSSVLFDQEWQQLTERMPNLQVSLIDTKVSERINAEQLAKVCPDHKSRMAYVCGPQGLITASRGVLIELGVNEGDIKHELFGPKPITNLSRKVDGQITFARSHSQVKAVATQQKTLLELAEESNTKPVSGCRMGVCHQCVCRKKQGMVYNTLTESYSDTGAEDIQLCISVAVGDVTLDL